MLPSKWDKSSRLHWKNCHLHWILGRANILSKYVIQLFFCFGCGFCGFFPTLFTKAPALWTNFCCIAILYLWAQKVSLRFLKSYFKLKILTFLSFVLSFLANMLTKNLIFWQKTRQRWNLRHTLVDKLSKIDVTKY